MIWSQNNAGVVLRCWLNPHLVLLQAKATVPQATAPLAYMAPFCLGDLTPNNLCEFAWQGTSPPTPEMSHLRCLTTSVLLPWTRSGYLPAVLALRGGHVVSPLCEKLCGSESATPRRHASLLLPQPGWDVELQGNLGSCCQPGSLNDHVEDSCLDNPNTCPGLFLGQNSCGVKALKSWSLFVVVTHHTLTNALGLKKGNDLPIILPTNTRTRMFSLRTLTRFCAEPAGLSSSCLLPIFTPGPQLTETYLAPFLAHSRLQYFI